MSTEVVDWQNQITLNEVLNNHLAVDSLRPIRHSGLHEGHVWRGFGRSCWLLLHQRCHPKFACASHDPVLVFGSHGPR